MKTDNLHRILVCTLWLIAPLLFGACNEDESPGITLSLSQETVASQASTVELQIVARGAWTLTFSEKWVKPQALSEDAWGDAHETLSGQGPATVVLDISENRDSDVRGVVLVAKDAGAFSKAVLVQYGAQLVLEPTEVVFDHLATPVSVTVNTVGRWHIRNAADVPWCHFSQEKGGRYATLTLTPDAYEGQQGREPVAIDFVCGDEVKTLTVSHPFVVVSAAEPLAPEDKGINIDLYPLLKWTASENYQGGEVFYNVYLSTDDVNWYPLAEQMTETSFQVTEKLRNETRYYWRVDATDGGENTTAGRSCTFVTVARSAYEDGECRVYQEASVSGVQPYTLVVLGDGFVAEDYLRDGNFDMQVDALMTGFFATEPFKSYKNYFRVVKVAAISKERGATIKKDVTTGGKPKACVKNTVFGSTLEGGGSATVSNPDNDKIYEYALKCPGASANVNNIGVFLLVNVDAAAGTTTTYRQGKFISRTCLDGNQVQRLLHEGGGHGIGRLKDEYIDFASDPLPQSDKNQINEYRADKGDPFWYAGNVDITGDRGQVHWKHYYITSGYGQVGLYEGCYLYGKGAWRAEPESIMQGSRSVLYFNAPSREAIVRRIATVAGFTFSWDVFRSKDVNAKPLSQTRSLVYPVGGHTPPEVLE